MRCFGGCLFLHRVVVSSFFSSSSNNSTRSLDVIVVGRSSKKPRKRVERLSPHLYKERDLIHVCVLLGKTTNKSFPPKNKKRNLFLSSLRVPSFSFGISKKQKGKSKNIFVLETGKKNVVKTKRAQNKTHARRKKKELARIKSTRTRASKGTR